MKLLTAKEARAMTNEQTDKNYVELIETILKDVKIRSSRGYDSVNVVVCKKCDLKKVKQALIDLGYSVTLDNRRYDYDVIAKIIVKW